jgi:hypothetical protein
MTAEEALAELRRADMVGVVTADTVESLCTLCSRPMLWTLDTQLWACESGCNPSRIADDLFEKARPMEVPAGLRHPDPSLARPVQWAWEGRIPIGRASLILGNEGVGKGTLIAWMASEWSHGTLNGELLGTPANVLIIGDEDALDDTWTPRLHAAGADWPHVFFPPDDCAELDVTTEDGCDRLGMWVKRNAIRIVVFDALLDHLGGTKVDEFKPKAVRNALRPLRRLARDRGFAAVGALHPKKGHALTFRDLMAASHQFNAVSRSSLLLAQHPEHKTRRVLARGKGNLTGDVPALEFEISSQKFDLNGHRFDQPHATDWKASTVKINDLLPGQRGRDDNDGRAERVEQVTKALNATPKSVRVIAAETGISKSAVDRILHTLSDDGDAVKSPDGWVSHVPHPESGTRDGTPQTCMVEPNLLSQETLSPNVQWDSQDPPDRTGGRDFSARPERNDSEADEREDWWQR